MRNWWIMIGIGLFFGSVLGAQNRLPYQQAVQYQKAAQAALQSQMSQEGKDCPNAATTVDENTCIQQVADQAKRDFDSFYQSLASILASRQESVDQLKKAQGQWAEYRESTCNAIFDFYKPGTIAPSAQTRCEIQLSRSRMRDLNAIYYTPLHN